MKILVVLGHPDSESFGAEIFLTFVDNIDTTLHQVEALELGKAQFDPVLRFGYRQRMPEDAFITRSQELIEWADHMVFVYPIWWSGAPSLLKGWIERVFTPGIAYSVNQNGHDIVNMLTGKMFIKRLKGKTGEIIATSMGPGWFSRVFSGPLSVPDSYGAASIKQTLFATCGIKSKGVMVLGNMGTSRDTAQMRQKFLQKVAARAQKLGK